MTTPNKPQLFRYTNEKLVRLEPANLAQLGIRERADLQRLLRDQIDIIEPGLFVLCEEFSEWHGSSRRVDLLCVDRAANIVVVELKRTEDGGHMELQALRYAAMCSPLTFEQAVESHEKYLVKSGKQDNARKSLLEFLDWSEAREADFGNRVRMILVAEDFSKEVTATVLWLNELNDQKLKVRCVRLKPYKLVQQPPAVDIVLIDVQPIIPLPEANDYLIRIRNKADAQRKSRPTDEIWADFIEKCDARLVSLARELHHWHEKITDESVALADGFTRLVRANGEHYYFFKLRPDGKVVITFMYFASKPPFTDLRTRSELLTRATAIPGLDVSEEQLSKKPNFPLANLLDESNKASFKQFIEWAIRTARSTAD